MGQTHTTFRFPRAIDAEVIFEGQQLATISPELHPSKNKCDLRMLGIKQFDKKLLAETAKLIASICPKAGKVKIYDGEPNLSSIFMGEKAQFKTPNMRAFFCSLFKMYMNAGAQPFAASHMLRSHQQDTVFFRINKKISEEHQVAQCCCITFNSDATFLLICDRPDAEGLVEAMTDILDEFWTGYGEEWEHVYKGAAVAYDFSGKCTEFNLKKPVFHHDDSSAYPVARKLVSVIMNCFGRKMGYNFLITMNCQHETDELFFVKYADGYMPKADVQSEDVKCLYLGATNLIATIDFPEDMVAEINKMCKAIDWNIETHDSIDLTDDAKSVLCEWLIERIHPFWTRGNSAVMARHFVINVLELMMKRGYHPAQAIQTSRKLNDKGMVTFIPGPKVPEARFLILSYSELGDIYFTGLFSEDVELAAWVKIITTYWPGGISKKLEYADRRLSPFIGENKSWQIRLDKGPWITTRFNNIGGHAMNVVQHINAQLFSTGWELLVTDRKSVV